MKRRIDSDVHVGVDAAWKSEIVPAVEDLLGLFGRNIRREAFDFSALNCNVQAIDRSLFWAHYANIFYDEIERLRHCHSSTAILVTGAPAGTPTICCLFCVPLAERQQFRRADQIVKTGKIEHPAAKRLGTAMLGQRGVI